MMFSIEGGDFMKNKILNQLNIEKFVCESNKVAENKQNNVYIVNIT